MGFNALRFNQFSKQDNGWRMAFSLSVQRKKKGSGRMWDISVKWRISKAKTQRKQKWVGAGSEKRREKVIERKNRLEREWDPNECCMMHLAVAPWEAFLTLFHTIKNHKHPSSPRTLAKTHWIWHFFSCFRAILFVRNGGQESWYSSFWSAPF